MRSGTTWVMEAIARMSRYRVIWEPFHPLHTCVGNAPAWGQYLEPGVNAPGLQASVEQVLRGEVRSVWTDSQNRARFARRRLVKDICTTNLLLWLVATFPRTRFVYVIRHPFSVAHSSMRWLDTGAEAASTQQIAAQLIDGPLRAQASFVTRCLERPRSRVESLVVRWCLENVLPITHLSGTSVHVAMYEQMLVDPRDELRSLASALGHPFRDEWAAAAVQGSRKLFETDDRKRGEPVAHEGVLAPWMSAFSTEEVRQGLIVLEAFGLDWLYRDEAMPRGALGTELPSRSSSSETRGAAPTTEIGC